MARGFDWERERRNRRIRRADGDPPALKRAADKPPTPKQLALLRKLALERGETFAMPRTSRQASARIKDLLAKPKR